MKNLRWLVLPLVAACGGGRTAAPPASQPTSPPTASPPAAPPAPKPPELRLPDTVKPLRAALDLTLIPSEPTFSGRASFDVEVKEAAPIVWLNATGLTLGQAGAEVGGATRVARVVPGNDDFVGLAFDPPLPAGPARLTVAWTGPVDGERSVGFYRVAEKPDEWYLFSFFEPIDARRAFPCFDEPSAKIPWKLVLHVRSSDVALANSAVTGETDEGNGRKRVEFAETRPLPSYLVALIVGPFDLVDGGTAGHHGTPLRFAIPHGRGGELRYALSVTPKIVGLLEDYFGMPYPYGKLDVAVPPRFWGTMEHPGLVALGQPMTLIKPEDESADRKRFYADIAIHELAHYWFGDYVTTAWWDDVWLNEAAAQWLDAKVTDQLDPSMKVTIERVGAVDGAMRLDGLPSAKKIRQPVLGKDDIANSFDAAITYTKGGAVIRMFEEYLGPERWQKMIRGYLAAHAWGNAVADDLLAALEKDAGPEVAAGFRGFLDRPGVPLVTARLECAAGKPPRLALAQTRFVPAGMPAGDDKPWTFPVCAHWRAGKDEGRACALLTGATGELPLDGAKRCPDWVMPNAGSSGYYRTAYDAAGARPFLRGAGKVLPIMERLRFFADLGALVDSGRFPLSEALAAVPALARERDSHLLGAAARISLSIRRDALPAGDQARLARFFRATFGPQARALGVTPRPGEGDDVKQQRRRLLGLVGVAGDDPEVGKAANALLWRWLDDRKAISPELVQTVGILGVRAGNRKLFDRLVAEARKATDRRERGELLAMTGGFRDAAGLDLVLDPAFDIRETSVIVFVALSAPETREAAWSWIEKHFDEVAGKMREDERMHLFGLPQLFCDKEWRARVASFLEPRAGKTPGAPRVLKSSLEGIDVCIAEQKLNAAAVAAFLKKY